MDKVPQETLLLRPTSLLLLSFIIVVLQEKAGETAAVASWAIRRKEMNQASAFFPSGPWSTTQEGVSPAVERNESQADGNLISYEPCNPEEPG